MKKLKSKTRKSKRTSKTINRKISRTNPSLKSFVPKFLRTEKKSKHLADASAIIPTKDGNIHLSSPKGFSVAELYSQLERFLTEDPNRIEITFIPRNKSEKFLLNRELPPEPNEEERLAQQLQFGGGFSPRGRRYPS